MTCPDCGNVEGQLVVHHPLYCFVRGFQFFVRILLKLAVALPQIGLAIFKTLVLLVPIPAAGRKQHQDNKYILDWYRCFPPTTV